MSVREQVKFRLFCVRVYIIAKVNVTRVSSSSGTWCPISTLNLLCAGLDAIGRLKVTGYYIVAFGQYHHLKVSICMYMFACCGDGDSIVMTDNTTSPGCKCQTWNWSAKSGDDIPAPAVCMYVQ